MGAEPDVVEFRWRPVSFLFPRGIVALLMLTALIVVLVEGETKILTLLLLALVTALQFVLPLLGFFSTLRRPVAIRLTPDGVRWPATNVFRSWGEVAAIRVLPRRGPRSLLPGVLLVSSRELDFARRSGTRPTGHGVDTRHLQDDREDVLAAILRFIDVPVYRD